MEHAAARIITLKKPECAGEIAEKSESRANVLRDLQGHLSHVPDHVERIMTHNESKSPASLAQVFREAARCEQTTP